MGDPRPSANFSSRLPAAIQRLRGWPGALVSGALVVAIVATAALIFLQGRGSQNHPSTLATVRTATPTGAAITDPNQTPGAPTATSAPVASNGSVEVTFVRAWDVSVLQNNWFTIAASGGDIAATVSTHSITAGMVYADFEYAAVAVSGGYQVPSDCRPNDTTDVIKGAREAAQNHLRKSLVAFGSAEADFISFVYNDASLICNPSAGTVQSSLFYYRVSEGATMYQGVYHRQDVLDAAVNRMKATVPAGWVYDQTIDTCSLYRVDTPVISSPPNTAQVGCQARSVIAWNWTPDRLAALAQQLAGRDVASANTLLASQAGVNTHEGQPQIILHGISRLPSDPRQIIFHVQRKVTLG